MVKMENGGKKQKLQSRIQNIVYILNIVYTLNIVHTLNIASKPSFAYIQPLICATNAH